MNLFKRWWWIFDYFVNILAFLAGILIVMLMLLVCYEVVIRYFLRQPAGWVVEVCEYMLLIITFFGTTWLLKEGRHIRVDFVTDKLSPRAQKFLGIITSALGMISCSFLFWYGALSTWDHFQRNTPIIKTLNTPKWILMIVIPLGGLLLTIQFGRQVYSLLGWGRTPPEKIEKKQI